MKVTIAEGGKGDRIAELVYEFAGYQCHSRATLTSLTDTRLTATEKGTARSPRCSGSSCAPPTPRR
ncbi:hypothetical protein NKH77_30325 [Streptomyces sp. M19]